MQEALPPLFAGGGRIAERIPGKEGRRNTGKKDTTTCFSQERKIPKGHKQGMEGVINLAREQKSVSKGGELGGGLALYLLHGGR